MKPPNLEEFINENGYAIIASEIPQEIGKPFGGVRELAGNWGEFGNKIITTERQVCARFVILRERSKEDFLAQHPKLAPLPHHKYFYEIRTD